MQKQGGIFQKWFKEFVGAVFTQSLHAVMLGVVIQLISTLQATQGQQGSDNTQSSDLLVSLVVVMGVSAITKFERMIRELFGIGGSALMGDANSNIMKAKHGIRSAASVGMRMAAPIKSGVEGLKTRSALKNDPDIKSKLDSGEYKFDSKGYMVRTHDSEAQQMAAQSGGDIGGVEPEAAPVINPDSSAGIVSAASNSGEGSAVDHVTEDIQNEIKKYQEAARNAERSARSAKDPAVKAGLLNAAEWSKQKANTLQSNLNSRLKPVTPAAPAPDSTTTTTSSAKTSPATKATDGDEVLSERERRKQELEDYKYEKMMKEKDAKEQEIVDKYNAAQKQVRSAGMKAILGTGASLAGFGIGNGAFDELSEVMITANAVSEPITHITNKSVERHENRNVQKATLNAALETEQKYNLKDSEIVQKVKISPEFINDPNAASMLSGAIANLKNQSQVQTIDTTVKVNQNVKEQVNVNTERTVTENVKQNVKQSVQNVKNTASRELSSLSLIRKGNYTGNVRGLNSSGTFNTRVDSVSDIN